MDLLTVAEAARELRVSPVTIRRYIKAGRLSCVRVGRLVRLRRDEIEHLAVPAVGPVVQSPDDLTAKYWAKIEQERRFEDAIRNGHTAEEAADIAGWLPTSDDDPIWNIVGMVDTEGLNEDVPDKYKQMYADFMEKRRRDAPLNERALIGEKLDQSDRD